MVSVLFVCLGNICRSPTAHGVFQTLVTRDGLDNVIVVDSAGTGDWHLDEEPDKRSQVVATTRGYDLSQLRSRLVTTQDFFEFDYVLAMDNKNITDLQLICPASSKSVLGLFLKLGDVKDMEGVPDPYYGEMVDFEKVLDLIELAAAGLLQRIKKKYKL